MTAQTLSIAGALERFAVSWKRRIIALCGVRAAWVAIASVLLMVYSDVLLQLSGDARLLLDGAAALLLLGTAAFTYFRYTRAVSEARLVARLVEQDEPSLHNDLINALEFEQTLATDSPLAVSRPLMREEVSIAFNRAATVQRVRTLTPPSLRKEAQVLAIGLIAALACIIVFKNAFASVLPRFLDPYGDHPPYSATRLAMDPAGITVDYGENVSIVATADGVQPEEVALVLEDSDGRIVNELPMLRNTDGKYAQTIEHATQDLTYYARIERGRSKRFQLAIGKTPRIGAVNISYTYPAYTKLPARTRQLGPDGVVRAYEGTQVEMSIASNRPLNGGELRVGGDTFALKPGGDPQSVLGTFTLRQSNDLEARIVDIEQNPSRDVFRGRVELQPDTKPRIAVVSPGRQSFAIPSAQVPIEIEAQDDLGVANITLFRSLNGSNDLSKTIFSSDGGDTQVTVIEVLDLADLGLRPGDVIDFYATAADTYPNVPQMEATPSHQIMIISDEQLQSFMQQETTSEDLKNQYAEFSDQLGALAKEQQEIEALTQTLKNAAAAGAQLQPDDQKKLEELSKRQSDLAEQTRQAGDAMRKKASEPVTFDIEKEFNKSLQEMAARLDRAREAMEKSAQGLKDSNQGDAAAQQLKLADAEQQQQEALKQLGQNKDQFAQQVDQPLDNMDRMYKLLQDVETFKEIYAAQVNLERQARSYREVTAPSLDQQVRLKELGEAQREIRNATIDLRNNFEKHATEVEAALPEVAKDARGIADGIDGRNIPTVMEQASSGLAAGNGSNGHTDAEEAARLLDEMIQRVKESAGAGSQACERLMITMGMNPGNTMSQMKNSMRPGFQPGQQFGGSSGGSSQSNNKFDVFGAEGSKMKPDKDSAMSKRRVNASAEEARDESEFAGAFEELDTEESMGPIVDGAESEPVAEEYREIIDAYFQRIAEENK